MTVTRSIAAPSQKQFQPSPVKFPSDDNSVLDIEDNNIMNIPRYNEHVIPVNSKNYGVRRLPLDEFIRLGCEDKFTFFIPPTSEKEPPEVKSMCNDLLPQMILIVMWPFKTNATTPEERDSGWKKHLESRKFNRHGDDGYNFNSKHCPLLKLGDKATEGHMYVII